MTDYFTKGDIDQLGADYPFHAGASRELLRGNLDRTLDQSGFRYQSLPHGANEYAEHTFTASDTYEDLTPEFGGWPLRVNHAEGSSGFRQLRVMFSGRIVHAGGSGTTTVRIHPLLGMPNSLSPTATGGLVGESSYGSVVFSTESWVTQSTTFDVPNTYFAGAGAIQYHEVCLHAIATSRATSLRLRAPYIEEVP